jgi:nitrogen regulatory protein PII
MVLKGDEAEEFIRKADENVRLMKQRRCKNHVWRKHYLNGGKVCQVCGKGKEKLTEQKMNKDEVIEWIYNLQLQTLTDELKDDIVEKIEELNQNKEDEHDNHNKK